MPGLLSPNPDKRKNPLICKMCLQHSHFHLIAHSQLQYDSANVEAFSGHMLCFTFVKMTVFFMALMMNVSPGHGPAVKFSH